MQIKEISNRIESVIERYSDKQISLFFFIFTFILRSVYSIIFYYTQPTPESNLYYELALDIIKQGKVLYDTVDPYYEFPGPVIPWLNALTILIFGKSYLGLYFVTAIGSALIVFYSYKLFRVILSKQLALIPTLWSSLYLFYFLYTPSPGKDIWMSFFMVYLTYKLIDLFYLKHYKLANLLLFTLMYSVSFHLDERFFIFIPLIFLYILFFETDRFKKFRIKKTIIFTTTTIILMIPWTIRNFHKHEKIVILSTRTEVFTDKIFGYESRGHMMDEYNDIYGAYYIHDYQFDSIISGTKKYTDAGVEISEILIEAMKKGEFPEPLTGYKAFCSRILTMFEPIQIKGRYERSGYFYYKKSLRHNIATFLFYGILFFFSFPGFYFLYRKNKHFFYIFLFIIVLYGLIHGLSIPYTNWRYRLPLDSFFILIGWYGIYSLLRINKKA